jgi:hypothetical protein
MRKQSTFLAAGLLSAFLASTALAQNTSPPNTNSNPPQATVKQAPGVDEVLKMVKAGVATDVIVNFVENSMFPYRLEPSDLITLKEQNVPDSVTTAMLKRGAFVRERIEQVRAETAERNRVNTSSAVLDPEGYDYFQYYYLYPRTLATANQRLYNPGIHSAFQSHSFGYGPAPFQAYAPSAFRRR